MAASMCVILELRKRNVQIWTGLQKRTSLATRIHTHKYNPFSAGSRSSLWLPYLYISIDNCRDGNRSMEHIFRYISTNRVAARNRLPIVRYAHASQLGIIHSNLIMWIYYFSNFKQNMVSILDIVQRVFPLSRNSFLSSFHYQNYLQWHSTMSKSMLSFIHLSWQIIHKICILKVLIMFPLHLHSLWVLPKMTFLL